MDFITWLAIVGLMIAAAILVCGIAVFVEATRFCKMERMYDKIAARYEDFLDLTAKKSMEITKESMRNLFREND